MPEHLDAGHEIICGTIGMGKSYWVLYKIVMSFLHDRPCCYLDPKGDTFRNLMTFFAATEQGRQIWDQYHKRIILLNPVARGDHLVGFNAIEPVGESLGEQVDGVALLANSLVSHIRRQSGFEMAEANRMQNIMSAAIGLLAEGGEGKLTLAELPLLFVPSYRWKGKKRVTETINPVVQKLLPKVRHHGTQSFWRDQWPTWTVNARRDWVQSTEGRIFQYLFDERLLMTVCTAGQGTLDFRRLVNQGYWLFVNIPYQLLSDTITTLLGNLIITRILYACMQRPPGSPPYRLILDEARFFNTGPLEVIMETSRAYNLWLTLVVQNLDQMSRARDGRIDYRLKETALNNCRYFSIFHDIADGEVLARMMFPLTGLVPTGIKASGDWEYLPIPAEADEHARRFQNLGYREMVWYDKLGSEPPRVWRTPEVIMEEVEPSRLDAFEESHLQTIGRPVAEIRRDIQERQDELRGLLAGREAPKEPERVLPPASFGEW